MDPHIVGRHVLHVDEGRQPAPHHHFGDALDQLALFTM